MSILYCMFNFVCVRRYYIHGKSAHGFSDTDMATLLEQLQREADDLCGHRGLVPGSDHQVGTPIFKTKAIEKNVRGEVEHLHPNNPVRTRAIL